MKHALTDTPISPVLRHHDASLSETLESLRARALPRRRALKALASAFAAPVGAWAACTAIPSETAGPFPGDGTNGPNALTQSGIVRQDITRSFGASGTALAAGVPLTVTLNLVNTNAACASLAGYVVYLWHCDAVGNYSMYSNGVTTQNYLRGVQITNASGAVSFKTIFPGCYSGRWPHMHFEVFASVEAAVSGRNALRISQLALPEAQSRTVYSEAAAIYQGSTANLDRVTLKSDGIFADDSTGAQIALTSGSVAAGYNAVLQVGIAGSSAQSIGNATTVEFYNSTLDHYVMITDPAEIALVESGGAGPGWSRTGKVFEFEAPPANNSLTVHRFYGSVIPGPNSHFYTISEAERAMLVALAAKTPASQPRWNYEASGGFKAGNINVDGSCVANAAGYAVPVFRLYNNAFAKGKDSNHRYTTSTTTVGEMQAKGWLLEGVVFCALK